MINGCKPKVSGAFLKLQGDKTSQIILSENDLSQTSTVADISQEVPENALTQISDHNSVDTMNK